MKFIELNKTAREKMIMDAYSSSVSQIEENAKMGKNTTELLIDKDIAPAVRDMLQENIANINFLIIRTGINPFTGRTDHFTGETVGNMRRYKVQIS